MFKFLRFNINLITRILVLSDFFLFLSSGLLSPIYAVFVLNKIHGSSLEIIGIATAIYWTSRVVSVVPLSHLMDRIKGEKDEYYFMLIGTLLIATLPLGYIFATEPWHIYLIQAMNGIAFSMIIPAWRVIFTKNLNNEHVSYEWSLDDVGVGIATAISAALGALIAQTFGFDVLFIFIYLVGLVSVLVLLLIYKGEGSFLEWLKMRRDGHAKKGL
ncbi:MAG TPA: MFS transporter [Candidatus Nanoarchaeia archaeon]|nr:MFS transporter [Candidatus Nanoarchaeia archaeon]